MIRPINKMMQLGILMVFLFSSFYSVEIVAQEDKIQNLQNQIESAKGIEKLYLSYLLIKEQRFIPNQDSLANVLIAESLLAQNDTLTGHAYYAKAKICRSKGQFDSLEIYARKALNIYNDNQLLDQAVKCQIELGFTKLVKNEIDAGDSIYQLANKIANDNDLDRMTKYEVLMGKATLGIVTNQKSKSIESYFKALELVADQPEAKKLPIYANLGLSFLATQNYEKSLEYYLKAIEIEKDGENFRGLGNLYGGVASVYFDIDSVDLSIEYYNNALACFEKLNVPTDIGRIKSRLANQYEKKGMYDEAFQMAKEAVDLLDQDERALSDLGYAYGVLGHQWINMGNPNNAIRDCKKAQEIYNQTKFPPLYQDFCDCFSMAYEAQGNFKESLNWYKKKAVSLKEFRDQVEERKIAQLEADYKVKKQESLAKQKELEYETSLLKSKNTRTLLLFGLGGLGLLCFVFFRNASLRRKNNLVLADKNLQIQQSLEEKDVLLREIHHRVKNNLQVISSLLALQSRQIEDEATKQAISEGRNRVRSMALIHQNLYQRENMTGVPIKEYLNKLIHELFDTYNINKDTVQLELDIQNINVDVDTMVPLGLIINELVSNSLKHAFPDQQSGLIKVTLKEEDNCLQLSVADNGIGTDKEIMNRSNSFGNRLINAFSQKLKASIDIINHNGTEVVMKISNYKLAA